MKRQVLIMSNPDESKTVSLVLNKDGQPPFVPVAHVDPEGQMTLNEGIPAKIKPQLELDVAAAKGAQKEQG